MDIFEFIKNEYGIEVKNQTLILEAFTHSSYINENKNAGNDYQRLEFLGDAVVEIWVSNCLYAAKPEISEGKMTTARSQLVCEKSLADFARKINLGKYIRLGQGENNDASRDRDSLLCDVFEAFIGAIYLDQGYPTVAKILEKIIDVVNHPELTGVVDYKSKLQEYVQADGARILKYTLVEETGPSNARQFEIACYLDNVLMGSAIASSKKKAEQLAAKIALGKLVK